MQDYTLTGDAVRTLDRMVRWWKRQPRSALGGGGPKFPPIPFQFRRFELKDDLTPGGSAEAYMLTWDGTSDYEFKQVNSTDFTFTVYDTVGDKRARGKDSMGEADGARGWAVHPHDVDRWEIKEMQCQAMRCTCQLTAALASTDPSISVDNISPTDSGQSVVASTGTLTAYNQRNPSSSGGFEGDDNSVSKIEWDENNDRWELYDVPCPSST